MRKKISTGRVFQKVYRDRHGRKQKTTTWILRFQDGGKTKEVSSGTDDYNEAVTELRKRMAKASSRGPCSDQPERVRIGQLLDLLIDDYRFKKRKSAYDTELRIKTHLRPFFDEMKAKSIGSKTIKQYVAKRQGQPRAEAATINKELSFLRRAMKLGAQQDPPLVERVPHFEMLPVDNVREGTLEHEQYRAIRDALPSYARIALVIAYHTGARKGEIRSIRKDKIDLKAKRINLPGRTTKNGKPRYLPVYGDMAAELDMTLSASDPKCPLLVQHEGKPVFEFKKAWATACKTAGVPEALFHDLRRTALTNMMEAGLSEKEAMEISGHRTRYVFDRYHIVSERRMKQNAQKLEDHLKSKEPAPKTEGSGEDTGGRQPEWSN